MNVTVIFGVNLLLDFSEENRPQFRFFVSKTDSDLFAFAQQLRFPALEMIAMEDQPAVRTAATMAMGMSSISGPSLTMRLKSYLSHTNIPGIFNEFIFDLRIEFA
jgi:hypothetical protein